MPFATERVEERPGNRSAATELGRAAASPSVGAGHCSSEFPLARPVGRGAGGLVRLIGKAFSYWWCRRRRATAIRELQKLNDRMLEDIGLTRAEITAALEGRLHRGGQRRMAQTPGTGFGAPQRWPSERNFARVAAGRGQHARPADGAPPDAATADVAIAPAGGRSL